MPSRLQILNDIQDTGLVAIVRADSSDQLIDLCRALVDGGVTVVEITMTTPGALDAIAEARDKLDGQCIIGVGSVLDPETARLAILAGAQFVVSPTTNLSVIELAHRYDKPIIPGALTPTEILNAFQAGADIVKVFPANHFGPQYLKDLLAPMPQLKLTPTGGIALDNIKDWLDAGACALGVGSALVKKDLIQARDWAGITKLAEQFTQAVQNARSE